MLVSPALICALSCAAGAAPFALRLSVVTRQRNEARSKANRFKDWWIAAETRALRAECCVSLAHEKHVAAGKLAHEAKRAKRAETTRALALSIGRPDLAARISDPLDAEIGSLSANRPAGAASASPAFVTRADQRRRPDSPTAEQKGLAHG